MLLPLIYCGNIEYYAIVAVCDSVTLDVHEHFIKQTYRSRCEILGPNGVQTLSIPVHKGNNTAVNDIRIDESKKWHREHWRALETAYNSAPFFEHYAPLFESIYANPPQMLSDLNFQLHHTICSCLGLSTESQESESFLPYQPNDFRLQISPKVESFYEHKPYYQVFQDRHGHQPNLSVLDLIFNEGPAAIDILKA